VASHDLGRPSAGARHGSRKTGFGTAILAALNTADGASHDVWSVNTEADYIEEGELVEALLEFSTADAAPVEAKA
jgi:hypothetical protein